jgi:hypothetical protein
MILLSSCMEDDPIPYYVDICIENENNVPIVLEAYEKNKLSKSISIKAGKKHEERVLYSTYTFLGINDISLDSVKIIFDGKKVFTAKCDKNNLANCKNDFVFSKSAGNGTKLRPLDRKYRVYRKRLSLVIDKSYLDRAIPIKK